MVSFCLVTCRPLQVRAEHIAGVMEGDLAGFELESKEFLSSSSGTCSSLRRFAVLNACRTGARWVT